MTTINCPPEANDCLFAQAEACRVYDQSFANRNSIADQVVCFIKRDVLAADLRLSLFVAAAQSFKYESLLKPIPEQFKASDGEVDIDRVLSLVDQFPLLDAAVGGDSDFDNQVPELLFSVLTASNHHLSSLSYQELVRRVGRQVKMSPVVPDYCFEVVSSPTQNLSWSKRLSTYSSFHAFHGSRFENFYSILNLGLHQHLNKVYNQFECFLMV